MTRRHMPRESVSIVIDAPCEAVFDLIHDYSCRLTWDTMLSEARLLGGATAAGIGVRTLCVGTWRSLYLALETEYVQFVPGQVAAVKLTNRPPLFEHFAATIRHEAVDEGSSRVTYIYFFQARPRFLAPVLEPVMNLMLKREVQQRLRSLRRFLEIQPVHGREAEGIQGQQFTPKGS